MAGHLDLRGHFDSDEDLGISRGYRTFPLNSRRETAYSLAWGLKEELSRSSADM
jgi:hypothetical protein